MKQEFLQLVEVTERVPTESSLLASGLSSVILAVILAERKRESGSVISSFRVVVTVASR